MLNLEVEVPSEPVIEQRLLHVAGCQELKERRGDESKVRDRSEYVQKPELDLDFVLDCP